MVKVEKDKCRFCGECLKVCSFDAIDYNRSSKKIELNENCISCGICIDSCAFEALYQDESVRHNSISDYKGVSVWAELQHHENGEYSVREVTFELLSKARELSSALKEKLSVIIIGDLLDDYSQFNDYGIDELYICDNEKLRNYTVEAYTRAVTAVIEKIKPSIFLLPASNRGRAVAPRVAGRVKTGLTADCTELEIGESGELHQIRPAFGGNIMATIKTPNHRPQIATVRPKTFCSVKSEFSSTPELIRVPVVLEQSDFLTEIISTVNEDKSGIDIEEAEIILAVGKGIGSKENIRLVEKLAQKMGAVVAGSRAVVESGWIDHCRQVGQSGKTVSPKLYIALGISGAVQHIVGMSSSEKIAAVNSDPDAPIFNCADYGIVGDYKTVCEALLEKL